MKDNEVQVIIDEEMGKDHHSILTADVVVDGSEVEVHAPFRRDATASQIAKYFMTLSFLILADSRLDMQDRRMLHKICVMAAKAVPCLDWDKGH
jgi:hypothetical protein